MYNYFINMYACLLIFTTFYNTEVYWRLCACVRMLVGVQTHTHIIYMDSIEINNLYENKYYYLH